MKILYYSFVLFSCSFFLYAQHPAIPIPGGVESHDKGLMKEIEQLQYQQKNDPSYSNTVQYMLNAVKTPRTLEGDGRPDTSCVRIIPVVFHVFHPQGKGGVPISQLEYAIEDLNRTFAGADEDYGKVNPVFANAKSYTNIRFSLAKRDPLGNATDGVVYYKDKQGGFGNIGASWENQIRTYAWDNAKYFNIYIQNDLYANSVYNNSGVCWYPSQWMTENNIARMVYNYVYLGKGGSSYNYLEFNQTFTHEAGHYLDLRHTFEGNSCTGDGDFCDDTPPTDAAAAGCDVNRCNGIINGENYMDYNTTCYRNFTIDQYNRMDAAMKHIARLSLWQPYNLVATGILKPNIQGDCFKEPFVSYSHTQLMESIDNDGTLENGTVHILASAGATFVNPGKTLISGEHYSPIELPAGLKETIKVSAGGDSLLFTISGKANNHASINSANVVFTLFDEAFSAGTDKLLQNISTKFSIVFQDPWKKTCVNSYVRASNDTTWNSFELKGSLPRFYGMWKNKDNYYLENYGRGIITESASSDNIVFLEPGTVIGSQSVWREGGSQGLLYSSTYNTLDNKTGYVGFRLQKGNDFYYGWMRIAISSTNGCTLLEYQYNEKPNEGISIGSGCSVALSTDEEIVNVQSLKVYPNPTQGTIAIDLPDAEYVGGTCSLISLNGNELLKMPIESQFAEYALHGIPSGTYIVQVKNSAGLQQIRTLCVINK